MYSNTVHAQFWLALVPLSLFTKTIGKQSGFLFYYYRATIFSLFMNVRGAGREGRDGCIRCNTDKKTDGQRDIMSVFSHFSFETLHLFIVAHVLRFSPKKPLYSPPKAHTFLKKDPPHAPQLYNLIYIS